MNTPVPEAKRLLRIQTAARFLGLSQHARDQGSTQARDLLVQQRAWKAARSVLLFAPMAGELNVWPLLAAALDGGKAVALPRYVRESRTYTACWVRDPDRDVGLGYFGIREPLPSCAPALLNSLDLVLVPGVAFDLHGRRLGRGKGYYDQLLAGVCGTTCGVAFDEQIVREVPLEPHDVLMNCILTPTRWVMP